MSTSVNGTLMYSPRPVCIDVATSVPPLVAPDFLINTEYHPYHGSVHNVNTLNETSTLDTPCPITTDFPLLFNLPPDVSQVALGKYTTVLPVTTVSPVLYLSWFILSKLIIVILEM